jgi:MFS family permease
MPKGSLKVIFLVVLMDLVGFGLILPILPLYAETLGGGPLFIGLLLSVYSLMQFLLNPVWGRISDRVGRRPVILFSLGGSVGSYVLYGLADRIDLPGPWVLAVLFASRLLAGVMGANIATAQAYVADVTTPDQRAQGMGMIGAAIGLGFVLGPALGAAFTAAPLRAHFGLSLPGFAAAAICAANLIWALTSLPESLSADNQRRARSTQPVGRLTVLIRNPALLLLVTCTFLVTISFSQFEASFALLSQHQFRLSPEQIGLIFSYLGVIVVVMQGAISRRLVRRLGERLVLLLGAVLMGLGLGGVPLAHGLTVVLLALGLLGVGFGAAQPALLALVSLHSTSHQQGLVLGVGQSMSSLARIVGPILALALFGHISMQAPYWIAATLLAAVAAITLYLIKPLPGRAFGEESRV